MSLGRQPDVLDNVEAAGMQRTRPQSVLDMKILALLGECEALHMQTAKLGKKNYLDLESICQTKYRSTGKG